MAHTTAAGCRDWPSARRPVIFGSLTRLVADTDALYRGHVRAVMLAMGYCAALLDTVAG